MPSFTRIRVLLASTAAILLAITFMYSWQVGLCKIESYTCSAYYDNLAISLFIAVPVFIFSLITYKMREEVFQIWAFFTMLWAPLTFFSTLATPGGQSYALPFPDEKAQIDLLLLTVYIVGSICILVVVRNKANRVRHD